MQVIQVNTDDNIEGGEELTLHVQAEIEASLARFGDQITRVEVHLSDENSHKGGANDKRCAMEARPAGRPPVAVTHSAATVDLAVNGASEKLERLLERAFGRLGNVKRNPYRGDETV
ncbi:MAG: HPF/RaiA family ribosome-associated protein [Nitrosospira sp.]|nr:HPF/RaiA family ribosome-associated protein [Nitrosospira sp.]